MFCIKCGVELSDGQKKCPLCDTVVYHPDITFPDVPGPYPLLKKDSEKLKPAGLLTILTMVFAMAGMLIFVIDFQGNQGITWSGYVTSGIILLYIWIALPFWLKRDNPVIYIPIDLIAAGGYLAYINYSTNGQWFLTFALPVILILTAILTVIAALLRYLHKGYLFIASGAWFALGVFMMMLEAFINFTFGVSDTLIWAPYPFAAGCLAGIILIVIAIHRPLREFLHKRFFI
jgi:hypothetical protein